MNFSHCTRPYETQSVTGTQRLVSLFFRPKLDGLWGRIVSCFNFLHFSPGVTLWKCRYSVSEQMTPIRVLIFLHYKFIYYFHSMWHLCTATLLSYCSNSASLDLSVDSHCGERITETKKKTKPKLNLYRNTSELKHCNELCIFSIQKNTHSEEWQCQTKLGISLSVMMILSLKYIPNGIRGWLGSIAPLTWKIKLKGNLPHFGAIWESKCLTRLWLIAH